MQSQLTWKRGWLGGGVILVLAIIAGLATQRSGAGCGDLIFGRWSQPIFVISMIGLSLGLVALGIGALSGEVRARKLGQGMLTAGVSLGLTVGLISGAMRLTKPPFIQPRPIMSNHETLGYFFSPNLRLESNGVAKEYGVTFHHDENGIIIREGSNKPRPNAIRIMFLGDSMLRGVEVEADQNMSVIAVHHIEDQSEGDVQQINLGVSGYSPTRHLLAYRVFKDIYTPDAVVVQLYVGNDFTEEARLYNEERVVLDAKGNPLSILPTKNYESETMWTNHAGMIPFSEARQRLMPDNAWKQGVLGLLRELLIAPVCKRLDLALILSSDEIAPKNSETFDDGQDLECRDLSGDITHLCTGSLIREESLLRNNEDAIYKSQYDLRDEADIDYTLNALRLLASEVEADGRDLLIVIVPLSHQIPSEGEGIKPRRGLSPGEVIASSAPQDILNTFCTKEGLNCLDLLPVFLEHQDEKLFWVYDTHLTPAAHALIGELIADTLDLSGAE